MCEKCGFWNIFVTGYQKCSKSDAVVLGALIFRAEYGDNKINMLDESK